MSEDCLRQSSIQDVAWLWLAAFSQGYSENFEQKNDGNTWKFYSLPKKRSTCKVGVKKSIPAEEIRAIKKEAKYFASG